MTKAMLCAALATVSLIACTSEAADDRGERDDADLLAEQADGKTDGFSACGNACAESLCGTDWVAGASSGTAVCRGDDSDAATRLAFTMAGGESATFDTRNIPFAPVMRLDHIYMYGLDVWNYRDRSGFELLFRDINQGSFVVGGKHNKGISLALYTDKFTGPGEYTAELGVVMSSVRTANDSESTRGNRYYTPDGCTLKVAANEAPEGGFRGSFHCANVPNKVGGAALKFTGEFLIPATAVDQTMIVAKPVR